MKKISFIKCPKFKFKTTECSDKVNRECKTMSSYPSELRGYSPVRGVAGSSPGDDTEFRLRKTSYTCALFKSLRPGPCKTVQHVVVLGLDLRQKLAES